MYKFFSKFRMCDIYQIHYPLAYAFAVQISSAVFGNNIMNIPSCSDYPRPFGQMRYNPAYLLIFGG